VVAGLSTSDCDIRSLAGKAISTSSAFTTSASRPLAAATLGSPAAARG